MSWEQHEIELDSASGVSLSGWWPLLVPAVVLLLVHVVRALMVRDSTAMRWLQVRSLEVTPASVAVARGYIGRSRWTRAGSAALLGTTAVLCVLLAQVPIGVVAAPYLLGVFLAELLAPAARRGRVRSGSLVRRSRTYFAPYRQVWLVRALFASAIPLALVGTAQPRVLGYAVVHAVVMGVALLLFEAGLHTLTARGLPDRGGELALDTAMRVSSARTTTAAGLISSTFGWLWSAGLASSVLTLPLPAAFAFGLLWNALLFGALALAISLMVPLPSWRPRGTT